MKTKKNGYTIFELVIVIGIIIILMGLTMRFGSSRIEDLQQQTSKEEFKNSYEQIILENMSSNYYREKRYDEMTISFQSGGMGFDYGLKNDNEIQSFTGFYDDKQIIGALISDGENHQNTTIVLEPYTLKCNIQTDQKDDTNTVLIKLIKKNKESCFLIEKPLCKIKNTSCN